MDWREQMQILQWRLLWFVAKMGNSVQVRHFSSNIAQEKEETLSTHCMKILCLVTLLIKVLILLEMATRQQAFSILLCHSWGGAHDKLDCPGQKQAGMFMLKWGTAAHLPSVLVPPYSPELCLSKISGPSTASVYGTYLGWGSTK